jgi:energy-coupling factor transport system permease protein
MSLAIPDKLSLVLLAWTCAFLLHWHYGVLCIVMLLALRITVPSLKPFSAVSDKYFKRYLAYSVFFVSVLVAANGLLIHTGPIRFNLVFLSFYEGGLQYGFSVSIRLVLLSLSVLLLFASTRFRDLADYLETIGLPNSLVTILLLTLFFLEQLPQKISQVFTAQEARGARVRAGILTRGQSLFLILSPLVLSSIIESTERGTALELRGYHSRKRTPFRATERTEHHLWRYVFAGISLILILASVFRWLPNL